MKKALILLLGIVMSFTLCGCDDKEETRTRERRKAEPSVVEEPPVNTPESVDIEDPDIVTVELVDYSDATFDFDSLATEDWQFAYKEVLDKYREDRADIEHALGTASESDMSDYLLGDMTGDGIPELLIRKGSGEAVYNIDIYTYEDGAAVYIDNIGAGHTSYYSVPGGEYMIAFWGHMGSSFMQTITIKDGAVVWENLYEEDINNTDQESYTEPDEIVEGAEYLSFACYCLDVPLISAAGKMNTSDGLTDTEVDDIIREAYNNNSDVFPVYVYHFREEPGEPMNFQEFLGTDGANQYGVDTLEIKDTILADINGDGQSECIAGLSDDSLVVFSVQGGIIYAYHAEYEPFSDITEANENGFYIHNDYTDAWHNIIFNKNEAYFSY